MWIMTADGWREVQCRALVPAVPDKPWRSPFATGAAQFDALFIKDGKDMRVTGDWYRVVGY